MPELAADLIRRRVGVIATPGSTPAAIAAKTATTTIPIVFTTSGDPVTLGLVTSLNRPGGNVTGIGSMTVELAATQAARFAALVDPASALTEATIKDLQADAPSLRLQVEILYASTNREIDAAFTNLVKTGGALLVSPGPLFINRRTQLVTLAARHALPTIYPVREYPDIGGLPRSFEPLRR